MEVNGSRQTPTDAELLRRSRRSAEAFRLLYDRSASYGPSRG